jgi:hypothetical protein
MPNESMSKTQAMGFGLKPPRKHRPGRSGSDPRKEESGSPWNPTVPFK